MCGYTISIDMQKFENKLEELKKIVEKLESGNISLDESLKQFETGTRLLGECFKSLEKYNKKIQILTEKKSGETELSDFEPESD